MGIRQFCRKGIHDCIPAVTLTFGGGAGRLHWCSEHAADAEQYRPSSDQRNSPGLPDSQGPGHLDGCQTDGGITTCADGCPRFAAIRASRGPAVLPQLHYHGARNATGGSVISVTDPADPTYFSVVAHLPKHSPTGFSWGYHGSGAADCARSLLAAALGPHGVCPHCEGTCKVVYETGQDSEPGTVYDYPRRATDSDDPELVDSCWCDRGLRMTPDRYQHFKAVFVAVWGERFTVTRSEIIDWCRAQWPDDDWPSVAPTA